MDIKKFSSSYGGTKENFVIINAGNVQQEVKQTEYSVFCVVQNIIQRGMPTTPSIFLQNALGSLDNLPPVYLISEELLSWNKIKGDTENADYPAETFFYEILPSVLGENAFLRNLIIPEADFGEILQRATVFEGQQVDFFFPLLRLVFEIDGYSHELSVQRSKDRDRDKELEKEGIRVVRIKTSDVKGKSSELGRIMREFLKVTDKSEILGRYKESIKVEKDDNRVRYDAVMRLQLFLLTCLLEGRLSLHDTKWEIKIQKSDVPGTEELLLTAYEDLKIWMSSIFSLLKYSVDFPELYTCKEESVRTILLDFSMFSRYSDTTCNDNKCIYVRTDYFPMNEYNYYRVACSETLQYNFLPESMEEDEKNLTLLMQNLFSFPEFREGQLPIIKNVLERKDTIGILPTGTGKSMCYQFSALLQPGVSIVVVPIIALMEDQKYSMDRKGIVRTGYISSSLSGEQKGSELKKFGLGQYQLIWIAPERFQSKQFRDELLYINKNLNYAHAVIDEVHCLSEWGHDFRTSYLTLVRTIREYCPQACLVGLTATASQAVLEDLKVEFENDGSGIKALTSMERKELIFVRETINSDEDRDALIDKIIKENDKCYVDKMGDEKKRIGLIFTPTTRGKTGCISIYNRLKGDSALRDRIAMYHAKIYGKDIVQKEFMDDKYSLMVCTKAFGMGIDKENIKYTIHARMPQSIETFYQEAGRAGRADKEIPAYCYIIHQPEQEELKDDIEKIFKADTSVEERRRFEKILKNDLKTFMYFWNLNHESIEEEYKNIYDILCLLYNGYEKLEFDDVEQEQNEESSSNCILKTKKLKIIQKALYKLSLLGIVYGWTIDYRSKDKGTVNVEYIGCETKNVYEHLMKYIRKYDPEFKLDVEVIRYKKYYELAHNSEGSVVRCIRILLEWTNDNILYNRLQSTYNMLSLCSPSVSDEEFRRRINDFFAYTEDTVWLERLIYNPLEYDTWFGLLKQKTTEDDEQTYVISKKNAAKILASLQRYLESYRYNTGFNYLSGILRLLCGQYEKSEGEWRLDESFQSIKESFGQEQQNEIIEETLLVGQELSLEDKDLLSKLLIKYYPDKAKYFYSRLQDRYSFSVEIEKHVNKIMRIMEDM